MDIIPTTSPKRLTSETTFSNYLLIVDAYSKIEKCYGIDKITTEEIIDKLDMLQYIFGKIYESRLQDLEKFSRYRYAICLHGIAGCMPNP